MTSANAARADRPVAIVSGGSRGLGLAFVRHLLDSGYRVATFSRTETEELKALRALPQYADGLHWGQVDGGDGDEVQRFVREVGRGFGRVDLLVNNAAIGLEGLLSLTRPADIERSLQVNLTLPLLLTRACLRPMLAGGGGCVVNVSSINAVRGQAGVTAYSAAKAALDGLTRSLAREVGPAGVRVVGLAPGYFESAMTENMPAETRRRITRRTPLGRLGEIEDMVAVFAFLVSDAARFVTGQTITVDGGYTC